MYDRRLQILLDDDRYQRVERVARERGTSVAAVIREAIDRGLPAGPRVRSAGARRILSAPDMEVPLDPSDLRRELDDLRGRRA